MLPPPPGRHATAGGESALGHARAVAPVCAGPARREAAAAADPPLASVSSSCARDETRLPRRWIRPLREVRRVLCRGLAQPEVGEDKWRRYFAGRELKLVRALGPRICRAAASYARAASSAVSKVPSQRRAPLLGSRISGRPTSRGEERRERGSGSGRLRKRCAPGETGNFGIHTCRQFRFVSCQCSGRTERGRRCMRRIIIRGGARGWSREHGRTFPMVSVERLCRWTNRFSSSWSQPWAEGCGEGAGKRRVRRRDRRPCGTPRI